MAVQEVIMAGVGALNLEKLNADIRAAVPSYSGHSTRPRVDGIILLFKETATPAEIATAQGILTSHDPNVKTGEQQARADLKAVAQTAVQVNYNDLTNTQLKALLATLIFESGGIANDLTIKPLGQWIR